MSAAAARKLRARNATEDAILAAAREALAEDGYEKLTMDGIARRAFTSRTNVYFYFANRRAVVDRLVQQTFAEMLVAGAPYLDGGGDPRHELRQALGRVVLVVNRNADILLLVARLSGAEQALPPEWEPYIRRFVRAAAERIARDQQRGVAPTDIPPGIARDRSESSHRQASATASGSPVSQPSGAWRSHAPASSSKPGMALAAIVRSGPAETRLARMPRAPRSRAR